MSHIPTVFARAVILILLTSVTAMAQQTSVWEMADTTDLQYIAAQTDLLAGANDRDFVTIGTSTTAALSRAARRSTDGGMTWSIVRMDNTMGESWKAVAHPSPDLIVVVGDSAELLMMDENFNEFFKRKGLMLRSADGGATWSAYRSDSNKQYGGISMCSPEHGVILQWHIPNRYNEAPGLIGDSLLRTTDGWQSWTSVGLPAGVRACRQVVCVQPDVYMLLVYDMGLKKYVVLRTTDGGATWQKSGGIPDGLEKMTFVDPMRGWAAGGIGSSVSGRTRDIVAHTLDGGMTWTIQHDLETVLDAGGLTDIDFADADNGIATGRQAKILRTRDGGATWVREFPPSIFRTYPINHLEYVKPDFALAAYSRGLMRFTGGQTLLPPSFITPALGSGALDVNNITLEWTPIEGATGYDMIVAAQTLNEITIDPSVYDNPHLNTTLTGTSTVLNGLKYHHRYYVRIRAKNATQQSDWHIREALFYTTQGVGAVELPAGQGMSTGSISIYPNPVTGDAMVHLHGITVPADARLEICNALGQQVRSVAVGESRTIHIATEGLAAGTYRVRLIAGERNVTAPLVIVR